MSKCLCCDTPLPVDDAVCGDCAHDLELELELEVARGTMVRRCVSCGRRRTHWTPESPCACGMTTVELVDAPTSN